MPKRDPRVGTYIETSAPFARPILKHLRKVIHEGAPEIEESLKWGMPGFIYKDKIVCGIAGFKGHCALWFWKGKAIVGSTPGEGMGNFGRITRIENLPSATKIQTYVRKAMKRIERRALTSGSSGRPRVPRARR